MKRIRYERQAGQAKTVSAFLMLFLEDAQDIGLFVLLASTVNIKRKAVVDRVLNKAQTVIARLVMGCQHRTALNRVLREAAMAAHELGLFRFADESHLKRYVTRFRQDHVAPLGQVQQGMFIPQSPARRAVGQRVLDIDQGGWVVNGKTYEGARQGYFPHKRGELGDQLSVAYSGA